MNKLIKIFQHNKMCALDWFRVADRCVRFKSTYAANKQWKSSFSSCVFGRAKKERAYVWWCVSYDSLNIGDNKLPCAAADTHTQRVKEEAKTRGGERVMAATKKCLFEKHETGGLHLEPMKMLFSAVHTRTHTPQPWWKDKSAKWKTFLA